jgi:class 3 adenylate cyclase/predicted negative regulator of RcsB-dependent stress response
MDVGEWLKSLGLGQYEAAFRGHEIEADVLADLTESDFEKIGLPLGARKRLMKAIANLAQAAPPPSTPSPSQAKPPPFRTDSAERRPITVLFCDLVGSTSLAAKLDAEDWRNLVNAYLDEATGAVTGLGGHVLKRLGDGLMALFGYPQAQENDAERAVRAALAIQRALSDLNARNTGKGAQELSARVGLESGPVVVEASGEVFGDAPNIAARVQAAADPGSVLITTNVHRQVAGLFVVEERGAHELKGASTPVALYRVVRASGGRRFGARTLTPLVGREEELDLLRRRWERAARGEGQLALVVGEPGIGKSRLVEELRLKLGETPHTWVEFSSSQLLQNTPLHPIAEWGRQRFGGADTPAGQRLADLENTLQLVGLDPAEHAPLVAPLVDIPLPPGGGANLPPEELRRRQLAGLIAWFLAGARSQPAALVFEDLHWADPTTLDLMQALAERGAQAPLLIPATTRPEFRPPWSLRSHHSVISLSPLGRADVAQMVGELSARHALSKEVVDGVSERTGGVPLFVEEVTRLLLERGEAGGLQAIPPTLQQSLAARLDRLGEAREVAQIGAVLGRDFTYAVLRAVGGVEDAALRSALDRLADADLLIAEGAGPEGNYRFKHALIQDAAYDSLLKSRRQALHRRTAEVLRDQPEPAAAEPEVIAHHFTQAGLDDLAIEWWGKAGDQALRRSAFQEAIAHLGKAIAMADKAAGADSAPAAGDEAASHRRMKLQTDYGQAVMWSKGFAAEETKAAFARAAELAAKSDDFSERFAAAHGQWTMAHVRGELRSARELASAFLREAEEVGRVTEAGVARRALALISYLHGDFVEARTHCERALAISDPEHEEETRERYGEYTGTVATACLAVTTWHLGEIERARELIEIANRRATELGHPPSIAGQLFQRCKLEILRGDAAAALSAAEALEALSREHGLALFRLWAELFTAWARGRLHDPAAAAAELRRALATLTDQGQMLAAPLFYALLAELEAQALGAERGLVCIDEALALADQIDQRDCLSFMHRLRGDILLKRDPADTTSAEETYKTAIAIAKEQGSRSFGLRAALALAKFYQSTALPVEAHAVLAPALEGFAPTPEMPEIAEAQTLLAALAETDEAKNAAAARQRRLQLQTAYGRALMWSKGISSEEARAAFARARELAASTGNVDERFDTYYGLWITSLRRAELRLAQEIAETFRHEAETLGSLTEVAAADRLLGRTYYCQGDFASAKAHLEAALKIYEPERDRETRFRFGVDTYFCATLYMSAVTQMLGDIEGARQLIEQSVARAVESDHVPELMNAYLFKAEHELRLGRAEAALRAAEILDDIHRNRQTENWGVMHAAWARARLSDRKIGIAELRRALADCAQEKNNLAIPFFEGRLAELEAEEGDFEQALTRINEALAFARVTGVHMSDAFLHRIHGEILLKRDSINRAPAEEAFQTALGIAQQQGGRFYGLQAALALAKLYQSTGRLADAHAVLAPALDGFSPTPEMPEIAEAQALLEQMESPSGRPG